MGRESKNKGIYVCIELIHFVIQQELIRASQGALAVKYLPASAGDIRDVGCISGSSMATQPIFLPGKSHGQRILEGIESQRAGHD